MKKTFLIALSALTLIMSNSAFSLSDNETLYHCPSIQDIKYQRGQFTATTNYNGVSVNWYDITLFPEATVPVTRFLYANGANNCAGGLCAIECEYKIESRRSDTIRLAVSYGEYEFSQPVSGAWVDQKCEAGSAEECLFTVVKRQW